MVATKGKIETFLKRESKNMWNYKPQLLIDPETGLPFDVEGNLASGMPTLVPRDLMNVLDAPLLTGSETLPMGQATGRSTSLAGGGMGGWGQAGMMGAMMAGNILGDLLSKQKLPTYYPQGAPAPHYGDKPLINIGASPFNGYSGQEDLRKLLLSQVLMRRT